VRPSSRGASDLLANAFDRFELEDGVFGWVYRFENRAPLFVPTHAVQGHEIAVQLRGSWSVSLWNGSFVRHEAGSVFTVPAGVRHTYRFEACEAPGLQVGFSVPGTGTNAWARETVTGPRAAAFVELAHRVLAWRTTDPSAPARDATPIAHDLRALVGREMVMRDETPFLRARHELERHLDRPLYLAHLAESAGLHEKTLARRFIAETGMPPIQLRTELRLQRAIRLLWSDRAMTVARAAERVGFPDARFLHRVALRTLGMTPRELARRPAEPPTIR